MSETQSTPIRRALISVSDKSNLAEFARALADRNVEIISTGGTAKFLKDAGVMTTPVEAITGFPEIMDGRVKTLHPIIHGGLLGLTDKDTHIQAMRLHKIEPIDLVCVNLYPFEETVAKDGVSYAEAVEQIDIGGPSMIRSAAKNAQRITVATNPSQYTQILEELEANNGATTPELRRTLMQAAFAMTSAYDTAIAAYLSKDASQEESTFPAVFSPRYEKADDLRYGENPHQAAALYRDPAHTVPSIASAKQHHGKALSFNNIADAAAALELAIDLKAATGQPSACVIKHANPCGASCAPTLVEAVNAAMNGDPLAAFGGIVATTDTIDALSAQRLAEDGTFLEVIVAPAYNEDALDILKARWANVRLLEIGSLDRAHNIQNAELKSIRGGALLQSTDSIPVRTDEWQHAAGPAPGPSNLKAAAAVWVMSKNLRSNAIAIGGAHENATALFGGGAGQMDRVASCRIAVEKAAARARGAIAASDAFFPFPDGPEILIDAGVSMIVHPGGSKRDDETIELCEKRGVTCMLTGVRHFKH